MDVVRKPRLTEVVAVRKLIDSAADRGEVLPRTLPELYENARDFYVYIDAAGEVGGCVALHIDMVDLAEVRSLVVRKDLRGRGVGQRLVDAVAKEAGQLDIARVYAFTRMTGFFQRAGFQEVAKDTLPYKVFKDCMRCPLFPDCDEIAVVREIDTRPAAAHAGAGAAHQTGE
mgnify:CR=1 FL=1